MTDFEREPLDVGERRVAGAEIVHGDGDAPAGAAGAILPAACFHVLHDDAFGQLEFERGGGDAGVLRVVATAAAKSARANCSAETLTATRPVPRASPHRARWRQASPQHPGRRWRTISPHSSASGTNTAGETLPSDGLSQRSSASTPASAAGAQVELGLVSEVQFPALQAVRRLALHLQPLLIGAVHLRRERPARCCGRAPWRGTWRRWRCARARWHRPGVVRVDADADGCSHEQFVAVNLKRIGHRVAEFHRHPRRAFAGIGSAGSTSVNSSPPVRASVSLLRMAGLQPARHLLQQGVAHAVARAGR